MKVSVLIPTYNAERYLRETLQSVRDQTYSDWEMVVVDDGSADGTVEMARAAAAEDPRIRVVCQANAGIAGARNRGLEEADRYAQAVLLLDHDDLLEPTALSALTRALEARPEVVAAHGTARFVDERGNEIDPEVRDDAVALFVLEMRKGLQERIRLVGGKLVPQPDAADTTFSTLIVQNCIVTTGAVLMRRSAVEAAGGFDPETVPCDDWDLWIRLSRRGPLAYVRQPVIAHRRHATNTSADQDLMHRATAVTRRKSLTSAENSIEHRQIAMTALRQYEVLEYRSRMRWARDGLCHGQVVSATKQLRHAALALLRYALNRPKAFAGTGPPIRHGMAAGPRG